MHLYWLDSCRKQARGNLVFGFAVKNDAPDLKFFITDVKVRWLVRVVEDGLRNSEGRLSWLIQV